jgi:peptide/nickel transport system substrate-binding protein
VLRRRLTSGLAVVVLSAVAVGCGDGGSSGSGGGAATAMTIATGALPSVIDFDPESAADGQSSGYLSRQMSGTLFGYNGMKNNPDTSAAVLPAEPELATGATVSPDGLTWTVSLRPDVKSQHGNTFSAPDVEWTIRRALDRKKSAATNLGLININPANPVTVVDDRTVAFNLTKPSHLFSDVLTIPSLAIFDSKAVKEKAGAADPWGYEWLKTNTASFGPYQLETSELPAKVVLGSNPNYWRGAPTVKRVTFVAMAESSTRLQAVLTGAVDYAPSMEAKDRATLESSSTAKTYIQTAVGIHLYALFVLDNPEVADPNLRRALSLAIDRKAIVDSALNGVGAAATGCLAPVLNPPKTPDDVTVEPQIEEAKRLVALAKGPKKVTIGYASLYTGGSVIPEILKRDWEAIGVETTLRPYGSFTTWFADEADGKFGVGLGSFSPYVRDSSYMFYNLLKTGTAYNAGAFSDPAFDAATDQAWTGLTDDVRAKGTQQACDIVMADSPWAMLGLATGFTAINKRVTPFSAGSPVVYNMRLA